jgi:large subunit ribosomal protein L13
VGKLALPDGLCGESSFDQADLTPYPWPLRLLPLLGAARYPKAVLVRREPAAIPSSVRQGPQQHYPVRVTQSGRTNKNGFTVRTYSPKPGDITREWHVIDAEDVILGKLAAQTANLLRGKHKPQFAPHCDTGDFVVVVNAEKVALTGNKRVTKLSHRHSGYPGGLTSTPIGELLEKDARKVIEKAVWGMLPKNRLGRQMLKKLRVYSGPDHPHAAQKAKPFEITQISQ